MKHMAIVVAAFALLCSSAPAQTVQESTKASPKAQHVKALYHCPMHAEVTSNKPGTCPKCSMELVKVDAKKTAAPASSKAPAHAMKMNPAAKPMKSVQSADTAGKNARAQSLVVYTCPMHPDVVSHTPGKCPRCKMELVKKNND